MCVQYQSRAVCVEHGQAAVHGLVLIHVLFEGKTTHQSGHNLLASTKIIQVISRSPVCEYVSAFMIYNQYLLERDSLHVAVDHPAEGSTQIVNHPEV